MEGFICLGSNLQSPSPSPLPLSKDVTSLRGAVVDSEIGGSEQLSAADMQEVSRDRIAAKGRRNAARYHGGKVLRA
jgi:hypothetical protein